MLHFILMLHALEKHCKKKKKHEYQVTFLSPRTYSHLQVALQDLIFYMSTSPTCIKGCSSISDWATHPPNMLMVWQRQGFGQCCVCHTDTKQKDYCLWRWQEVREYPMCFAAGFIFPYKAHAGTWDKIQFSPLSTLILKLSQKIQ